MTEEQEQLKVNDQLSLLDELLFTTTYEDVESGFSSDLHHWRDELRPRAQQHPRN
jgi:hypothetical protein